MSHNDAAQPGRICPVQSRLARQTLQLTGLEDDGGTGAVPDDDVRCRSGAIEQVAQGDASVAVDRIGLERNGPGQSRSGAEQRDGDAEDQGPHDFTCALTDSIWSAVVMTLEFIS